MTYKEAYMMKKAGYPYSDPRFTPEEMEAIKSYPNSQHDIWAYQKAKQELPKGTPIVAPGLPNGGYETFKKRWYEENGIPGLSGAWGLAFTPAAAGAAHVVLPIVGTVGVGSWLSGKIRGWGSDKLRNAQAKADQDAQLMQVQMNQWRQTNGKPIIEYRNVSENRADPTNTLPSAMDPYKKYQPGIGYVPNNQNTGTQTGSQKRFTHQTMVNQ